MHDSFTTIMERLTKPIAYNIENSSIDYMCKVLTQNFFYIHLDFYIQKDLCKMACENDVTMSHLQHTLHGHKVTYSKYKIWK